jgi:hypothetical protein
MGTHFMQVVGSWALDVYGDYIPEQDGGATPLL